MKRVGSRVNASSVGNGATKSAMYALGVASTLLAKQASDFAPGGGHCGESSSLSTSGLASSRLTFSRPPLQHSQTELLLHRRMEQRDVLRVRCVSR